jgi:hypothetical protein
MTKRVVVALLVGAIGLSLSSGLVAQQNVTIDDRAIALSRLRPAGPAWEYLRTCYHASRHRSPSAH